MPSKIFFIKLFSCLFYASIAQAEIITDGTLGERIHLHAPDYDITEDLGQQVGHNLFHSFAQFNLHPGQTATFFGTNDIHNIITRVTGGEASLINGRLVSNIPDASFYLINPYGITFGKHTHLDIQGSFHATTADYVKLEDNSEFHARYPEKTILSVADVHSFGFLTQQAAAITIRSNGKLAAEPDKRANMLHLKPNSTLSLIGGDISILQGSYIKTLDEDGDEIVERLPQIDIAGGNIFLVAVASQGEVIVDPEIDTGVNVSAITRFADIALRDYSEIRASGQNDGSIHLIGKQVLLDNGSQLSINMDNNTEISGSLLIRAEQFLLTRGSQIQASTTGRSQGMLMRIEAEDVQLSGYDTELKQPSIIYQETQTSIDTNEAAGILEVDARNIILDDGSSIYTNTITKKNAPELSIKAREQLILQGNNSEQLGSNIYSYSNATTEHDSGRIHISAQNLTLLDGAFIGVETFGKGGSGDIFINNTGNIIIRGTDKLGQASQILADAYARDKQINVGDAGDIFIDAENLTLEQGGNISSSVIAREGEIVGNSGKIEIILTGDLHISGINPHGELIDGISSGIRVQAREVGGKTGVAGNIEITAANVTIQHGGEINTNTTGNSNAGNIVIDAAQITVSGYATDDDLTRPMTTAQQAFQDEFPEQVKTSPYVSSISASTSEYYPRTTGNAGTIEINVNQLEVNNAGVITNQTGNLGGGGNITITAQNINVEKGGSITSQTIGGGHAGNIDINAEGVIRLFGTDSSGLASNIGSNSMQLPSKDDIVEAIECDTCDSVQFSFNKVKGGDAGSVYITSQDLILRDGANISSSTIAVQGQAAGRGGAISIDVSGTTDIEGINPYGENLFGISSGLYVRTVGSPDKLNVGSGGQLHLETGSLRLAQGGAINSTTNNKASGGNVNIFVENEANMSGYIHFSPNAKQAESQRIFNCLFDFPSKNILYSEINANSLFNGENAGKAGHINLEVGNLTLRNQARITSSGNSASAGRLSILADSTIRLHNQSIIATDSGESDGGEINLTSGELIHLLKDSTISTSVKQFVGDAGIIRLTSDFIITDRSRIKTTAIEGNGGDITVSASGGIFDRDARANTDIFNTSSSLGIDGAIELDVVDINMVAALNPLSLQLQRSEINYSFCDFGNSRFIVKPFTGQHHSPFDWQASSIKRERIKEF